jgi:hypothetical protein
MAFLLKKLIFSNENFQIITWYPNMVRMVQNLFKLFLEYICVFEYTSTIVSTNILQSPTL